MLPRVRRGRRILVASSAVAIALCASATAATTVPDPAGDLYAAPPNGLAAADVDIRSASVDRANGRVEFTVRVAGSMAKIIGRSDAAPYISVFTPVPKAYAVTRRSGKYRVVYAGNPLAAKVTVRRPNQHTAAFSFKLSAIGSPGKFKWRVTTGACVVLDGAPNSGLANGRPAHRC